MQDQLIVKDVEEQLLNQRKRRRKVGEVPYPLDYSSKMLNFDNWDHMFLMNCCQSLTIHQFTEPPSVVLDLGCGGGYWAIEAAKQWKDSTIVGFDLKKMQPSNSVLGSLNVRWEHGNLLDGLPFGSDHFDFVRIVGIGLGVPEDEWQYVLEEVARVMKPGAVIEMIEEDLIFPCGQRPLSRTPDDTSSVETTRPGSLALSVTISQPEGWPAWLPNDLSNDDTLPKSPSFTPLSTYFSSHSFLLSQSTLVARYDRDDHPQDHTKLKAAWEAMLSNRFLTAQLVTVLPFYLSSLFVDVRTHPSIQIPLPPNSDSSSRDDRFLNEDGSTIDLDHFSILKTFSGRTSADDSPFTQPKVSQRRVQSCASMHLAKTVQTIIECKESIWAEYDKLYGPSERVTQSAGGKESQRSPPLRAASLTRDDFERGWSNWESDMMDRINMRNCMALECSWSEPIGEQPSWKVRRKRFSEWGGDWQDPSRSPSGTAGLCRSLRAFVGWKPSSK